MRARRPADPQWPELDGPLAYELRACASGELCLLADATLDRTTDAHGGVELRTLPEISGLDAGGWFDARFAGEPLANLLIGIAGVVLFTGITAWDVQRLKNGAMPNINKDSATVMGALMLYLDFINLFLFMLRIFGSNR